jgi:hypothetical protein
LIRNQTPPIKLVLNNEFDTSYFKTDHLKDDDEEIETTKENIEKDLENPFHDFHFKSKTLVKDLKESNSLKEKNSPLVQKESIEKESELEIDEKIETKEN